ncbi:MAG: alpha/beta fold hydrolase [Clostridia bacterium]|nr:alpha/beta fold hydrolase [Clostridia bacterium]
MIFDTQIEKMYRAQMFSRQEMLPTVFYFSYESFRGLNREPYLFRAISGHFLQGYFYFYDAPAKDRLVVFDHGMGAGHRAYMREIERLARAGYLVFTYDHTGCVESEGESTCGFAQSLSDLDACIRALKAEPTLANRSLSVVGHSWGAFACLNITALHPEITHVVALSGFISVKKILEQNFKGIMKPYRKHLFALEKETNPNYAEYDAVTTLKNTTAKVLLIYSSNDTLVDKTTHFDTLYKALTDQENIRFLLVDEKGHNPNYTVDAVRYMKYFFDIMKKKMKAHELDDDKMQYAFKKSFDWDRMTAQDEDVWAEILGALRA